MNPYYATAFLGALYFWVWPAFLYKTLDAHWAIVLGVSAALILGAGRLASEVHVRFIAPRKPPSGPLPAIGVACLLIVGVAALTRLAYDA
jgi:hypothetical protein